MDSEKSVDLDGLSAYRITCLPDSFFYIPNFLSNEESTALQAKIPPNRWTQLTHRRLQAHPSTLTNNNILISTLLPPWLITSPVSILKRFTDLQVFKDTKHEAPNHVLINEYKPGEGIMPHEDGNAYSPVVATISLGGSIVLDIYEKSSENESTGKPKWRILQEPGSLLITTGEAYENLLHGIAPIEADEDLNDATVANWSLLGDASAFANDVNHRDTRISFTYRDVLKVSKVGMGILGIGRGK